MSVVQWRPRNETPEDREHEERARERIAAAYGCQLVKLSEALYEVDWAAFRGTELRGWCEFKRRARRYDTLLLGFAKWSRGCQLARESKVVFTVFVEWPDGVYAYTTDGHEYLPVTVGGNDRGQNGDTEPVVLLPASKFKRVYRVPNGED